MCHEKKKVENRWYEGFSYTENIIRWLCSFDLLFFYTKSQVGSLLSLLGNEKPTLTFLSASFTWPQSFTINYITISYQLDKIPVARMLSHAQRSVLLEYLSHTLKSTGNKAHNRIEITLVGLVDTILFASLVSWPVTLSASVMSRGQNLVVTSILLLLVNAFWQCLGILLGKKNLDKHKFI